jgi:hypothetical protein
LCGASVSLLVGALPGRDSCTIYAWSFSFSLTYLLESWAEKGEQFTALLVSCFNCSNE